MSEAKTSTAEIAVGKDKTKLSPPHDLPLNLDLYNYDTPDAQSCPYVLTSPRSLEACSRVGIKPVDLLFKTLVEFTNDFNTENSTEEVQKQYDEHEKHRIVLLKKCQAERDFIIWRTSPKPRSQSLSPCRHVCRNAKGSYTCTAIHSTNVVKSEENLSVICDGRQGDVSSCHLRNPSVKSHERQPVCWSTPASPYFRGSSNLFVRITSPVVCAKLQTFPRNKMRLPPKEMKILEVMLQKYETQEKDEQRRAKAAMIWDREKEERDRRREMAELDRWKALALKQRRCCSEERAKAATDDSDSSSTCSRHLASTKKPKKSQKRHSFKYPKNQRAAAEKSFLSGGRMSRYDADQKLKEIRIREAEVERRRQEIIHKRDDDLKRSAEELREKIKQVKLNQQDLDKSMEEWQKQVIGYQDACNTRASEKVTELFEKRKLKIRNERLNRQAEHKKNMKKIEAEEYAKLQEMMEKLRSKDERSRAFVQEKHSSIEQSRQLAQAASDLRDLIRQKLDKELFVKRSQQAMLESRLLCLQPHEHANKSSEPPDDASTSSS